MITQTEIWEALYRVSLALDDELQGKHELSACAQGGYCASHRAIQQANHVLNNWRLPMNDKRYQYWVYVCNKNDQLIKTVIETDSFPEAYDAARAEVGLFGKHRKRTVRLCEDKRTQGYVTIWMAGPNERRA